LQGTQAYPGIPGQRARASVQRRIEEESNDKNDQWQKRNYDKNDYYCQESSILATWEQNDGHWNEKMVRLFTSDTVKHKNK
jgi:hypothetical protein